MPKTAVREDTADSRAVPRRVRVVVFTRLSERQLDRIRAVGRGVDVTYVGDELCIHEERSRLSVSAAEAAARLEPLMRHAEVALGYPVDFDPPYATELKWAQLLAAGTNHHHNGPLWRSDALVTNASGIHATAIGEHGLMCMLMLANDATRIFRQQQGHRWEAWHRPTLAGRSVGILGYGSIGSELARLSAACRMTVRALDATFPSRRLNIGHVDETYAVNQLHAMLAESDYVVNCLPLTAATRHLIGAREMAVMPRGGFIVSLSRGPIVDFQALTAALQGGHLGGAALDVTEPEPLPSDSPLWDMPNVIITPHIAGVFEGYMDRLTDLFCRNLQLYLDGRPLLNVVNKELGY